MNHSRFLHRFIFTLSLLAAVLSHSGARADTVRVTISGIEDTLYENVVAFLTLLQNPVSDKPLLPLVFGQTIPKVELTERKLKRAHRLAPDEIRLALQPFGFYQPVIEATLLQDGAIWRARYAIDPGQPTMINTVNLSVNGPGKDDDNVKNVALSSQLELGQTLSHQTYETFKKELLQAARKVGYLDAIFINSEIQIDKAKFTADIILDFDTGPLFYFGQVDIQQNSLETAIVKRFLPFKTGDPFNARKLISLQLRLEDTEYFSEVDVQARRDSAVEQQIPVVVIASAAKPQRYSIGAGFGTDTGPRLNLGINIRRVNQKGHQFRADVRTSTISSSIQAQYQIPINHGSKDHIALTASATAETIADTETESVLLGVSRFESWRGFQRQVYTNYEREVFDIGEGQQNIELLIPGISLSKKSASDLTYPRRGFSFDLDIHGASDAAISDTSFLQGKLSAATVWPLGPKGRLLLRGEYGATEADDFSLLPLTQRFFAGGDRSVRGYDYQQLAPANAEDVRIGGQYLAAFSAEIDYLFYQNYGVAGFVDAGNASNDPIPSLRYAAGVGFRYRSPIGMIRLDVAHPVGNNEDGGYRVHVSIGADL